MCFICFCFNVAINLRVNVLGKRSDLRKSVMSNISSNMGYRVLPCSYIGLLTLALYKPFTCKLPKAYVLL